MIMPILTKHGPSQICFFPVSILNMIMRGKRKAKNPQASFKRQRTFKMQWLFLKLNGRLSNTTELLMEILSSYPGMENVVNFPNYLQKLQKYQH